MLDAMPDAMQALMSDDETKASLPNLDSMIEQWNQVKGEQAIDADTLREMAKDPAMAKTLISAQKAVFSYVDALASVLAKQLLNASPDKPDARPSGTTDIQFLAKRSQEKAKRARECKAYAKKVVIAGIINFGNKDWRIEEPFTGWTAEQNPSLPLALLMLGPLEPPSENAHQVPAA